MRATFAEAASCWAGLAARLLGWRPADFWSATPGELAMALTEPEPFAAFSPPSRELIVRMMERDGHE